MMLLDALHTKVATTRTVGLAIAGAALVMSPVAASAQNASTSLLKPWMGEGLYDSQVEGLIQGEADSEGTAFNTTLSQFDLSWRTRTEASRYAPSFGVAYNFLDIDSDDPLLPEQLVNVSVGASKTYQLEGGQDLQLSLGAGYAGDGPFADGNAWYGTATLALTEQLDDSTTLTWLVSYDGNRSFMPDVPLPGIAYTVRQDAQTTYSLGIPYSFLRWQPDEQWSVQVDYFIPTNISGKVSYAIDDEWTVFGLYRKSVDAWRVSGQSTTRRTFLEQSRFEGGVEWSAGPEMSLVVAGGFMFSQEFSTGFDSRDLSTVRELSDEPYVRFALSMQY